MAKDKKELKETKQDDGLVTYIKPDDTEIHINTSVANIKLAEELGWKRKEVE